MQSNRRSQKKKRTLKGSSSSISESDESYNPTESNGAQINLIGNFSESTVQLTTKLHQNGAYYEGKVILCFFKKKQAS
jgi:hypothetical protein